MFELELSPRKEIDITSISKNFVCMSREEIAKSVSDHLITWLDEHDYFEDMDVNVLVAFSELGLTSMDSVALAEKINIDFGVELDATAAWQYPNVSRLSQHIATLIQRHTQEHPESILVKDAHDAPRENDIAVQLEKLLGKNLKAEA
ncbi:acyl carrier protein [Pseudoalteromonas byunsanensis]|uniref:Carrier domain-containing protein n=1 Tax=Pseudoalteromonas byunsanensis TaxID=327939 RepID=A0A1S1NBA9_9GAMM|nr:acyl carrier protein [Pseudoalteromonas byunsanensis]OHU95999.1 hypothetical protein BIW53_09360 [Pseudoalteromonas byunsanensis]